MLSSLPGAAQAVVCLAVMLFSGFAMTRVTKKLSLPNVTAYITAGILLGPFALKVIPPSFVESTDFLPDIAVAFIAFGTGQFFRVDALKRSGPRVIWITACETLCAGLLVFVTLYIVMGIDLPFSIIMTALAAATAPTSTMMTIRQTGARGDYVDTLLQVMALDDIVGLMAFSIAASLAAAFAGGSVSVGEVCAPLFVNICVAVLGGACGVIMKLLMPRTRSGDNRLIISLAVLFAFCGVCTLMDVSPLLGCMTMGTVYINITGDDDLFKQLNYFSPPFLLLFFVRSGMSLDLSAMFSATGSVAGYSLAIIAIVYLLVRILGKYIGSFAGCILTKKAVSVRNFLGLALIPQASVAIGLASLGARSLGGSAGLALQNVILCSSILNELIGPACAKMSLSLSGAIAQGQLPPAEEAEADKGLSEAEKLIREIERIRSGIVPPVPPDEENEAAFLEAAEEMQRYAHVRSRRQRRR